MRSLPAPTRAPSPVVAQCFRDFAGFQEAASELPQPKRMHTTNTQGTCGGPDPVSNPNDEPVFSPGETRVRTGVAGLDEVLRGGLTPNRVYLIEGNPG